MAESLLVSNCLSIFDLVLAINCENVPSLSFSADPFASSFSACEKNVQGCMAPVTFRA